MRAQQITGELLDSVNMCWVGTGQLACARAFNEIEGSGYVLAEVGKQTPQITTPQILGLIRLSQIRKFLRFAGCKYANRKFAHFLRTNLSNICR